MSDKSPLFVSASELLAHSIDLYVDRNERKYKFVILHLANAVELILKDRIIDTGASIYKGQSSVTVGIWDAFSTLEKAGILVPERPIIELLVDDRNTIQHRFGFPNADAVFYYLDEVLKFFRRFLKSEYGVELAELLKLHVSEERLATIGIAEKKNATSSLDRLFEISPESAVMQAYGMIERRLVETLVVDPELRPELLRTSGTRDFTRVIAQLASEGALHEDAVAQWDYVRSMRNRAAHSAHFAEAVASGDWEQALSIAKGLLKGIEQAVADGHLEKLREPMQAMIRERMQARRAIRYLRADEPRVYHPVEVMSIEGTDGPAA